MAPAGGHQKLVVGNPFAALQLYELLPGVDGSSPHPQPELDALRAIVVGGFDQLILEAFFLTKIALRQRRPVVGGLGLGADEGVFTVEAVLPQARPRRGPTPGAATDT